VLKSVDFDAAILISKIYSVAISIESCDNDEMIIAGMNIYLF
jgi:hypothetical protein